MSLNNSKRTFDSFTEANGTSSPSTTTPNSKKPRTKDPTLWKKILALPLQEVQQLLFKTATESESSQARVQAAYEIHVAKKKALPPVNFDSYSKDCWHTLNKKYAWMKSSQQFMMMGEISTELSDSRVAIMKKAGPDTRFETRRNALEVLRKICKSVMLCDEQQIRHELLKDGMLLEEFAESMLELSKRMTVEERQKYKDEGLYEKLVDLEKECDETDMEGLQEIYAVFDGAFEDDGDGNDVDDADEDDDLVEIIPDRKSSLVSSTSVSSQPAAPQRTKVFSMAELL